jgi:hypothetical protein
MGDDFRMFREMKGRSDTALSCARAAKAVGLDFSAQIRMLRAVFVLDLDQAKETIVVADGRWSSLEDYQGHLLPALEAAFKAFDEESA